MGCLFEHLHVASVCRGESMRPLLIDLHRFYLFAFGETVAAHKSECSIDENFGFIY